ncbi:MAG: translesion DNA synthesis-associated protein ImuA [Betaproteobacteria bacterium]|nr:translesion DNA synthesis-associated protein ImuA [Betaproteobacteria bacterium]
MAHSPAGFDTLFLNRSVWRGGAPVPNFAALNSPRGVPTGFAALDLELPGGGWPVDGLAEIFCAEQGIGELQLLAPALAALSQAGKRIVWIAPPYRPYAPALTGAGIDPASLVVVQAASRGEALWAAEQSLRGGACAALLVWLRGTRYAELRRLALAAQSGNASCFLYRPEQEASESSPACLRLKLASQAGNLVLRILKRRGAPAVSPMTVPIKRPVHVVGGAASSQTCARSAVARPCLA